MPIDSPSYWVLGHHITPVETLGNYALLQGVTPAGIPGPPPHYHEDATELFLVTAGRLEVMVDGHWRTLAVGDSTCVPVRAVHTFRNPDAVEARWVTALSPRGFEGFFRDFGVPVEENGSFEASVSEASIARVIAECSRYGMILVDAGR
jgi:mannose-6-phosphate isomerase-like protein (cupin superfamily)